MSEDNYLQRKIDAYNDLPGKLTGYDCERCHNKGYVAVIEDGEEIMRECSCMPIRQSMRIIRESGLQEMLERYTFDSYTTSERWQAEAKRAAVAYAEHPSGWFFIGGAVGSGKTHLCTAICDRLMEQKIPVRYMLWRDEAVTLKAIVNEPDYEGRIKPYKTVRCLYIDDFFKVGRGNVTDGDINLAFEILNARYARENFYTIISSEKTIGDIIDIDEAVGSRIYQRSKGQYIAITQNGADWRLK